jgi:ABC-type polysaccharide/polyol phosphate export permease
VQLVTSYGLFFIPVFYEPGMLGGGRWVTLQMMNPVAPILEGLRLAAANGHNLLVPLASPGGATIWTPWYLWYALTCAVVGLLVSVVIFHRAQYRFAECV